MTKPLVIFVGERHDDFSYIALVDQLTQSFLEKGLKVSLFSEFKSQSEKITSDKLNYPGLNFESLTLEERQALEPDMKNLPENWREILGSVDRSLSTSDKMPDYYEHYHDQQETSRKAVLEGERKALSEIDPEAKDFEERKKAVEDEGRASWDKTFKQLVSQRDADYVASIQDDLKSSADDVVIVWSGGAHVKPIAEGLGIPQDGIIAVSNQDPTRVGGLTLTNFSIDPETKSVVIPISIKEKFQEIVNLKEASQASEKPDIPSYLEEEKQSFVERMRGGKDGGKSRDGYNEL